MELRLASTQFARRDIPKAGDPQLRLCSVPPAVASRPRFEGAANWVASSPGDAARFSAVAYYFGRELREKLNVPVGLILCSAGGTSIETWMPAASCRQVPSLARIDRLVEQVNADYRKESERNLDAWIAVARKAIATDSDPPPFVPADPKIIQRGWLPTGIFNGGIQPLIPYAIRGVVWYQGEANNGDGMWYLEKMQTLIHAWRDAWGEGDFPFLYVQIAPWSRYPVGNVEGIWEAQLAALSIPQTGMAVTTDLVPDINNIHPPQKMEVGQRLARWALAKTYGQHNLVFSGPLFRSATVLGDRIRIDFDQVGSGLATRDGKAPDSFQIGTADGFEDADATIDGGSVVVHSPRVQKPEFVRFAWKNTARANLINKEGLPASPFRTDCGPVKFTSGSRFVRRTLVQLSADPVAAAIRYTLDGSTPTEGSTAYTGPIEIRRTTVVGARLFAADGRRSLTTRATYTQVAPTPDGDKTLAPGLDYEFYFGKWCALPDFDSLRPESTGTVDSLTITAAPVSTLLALRFHGYLDIPTTGEYRFLLISDDGGRFFLDGKLCIDDDGQHGPVGKKSEPLKLTAGKHPLMITYHESWGGSALSLWYEGPGIAKREVPTTAYFHAER